MDMAMEMAMGKLRRKLADSSASDYDPAFDGDSNFSDYDHHHDSGVPGWLCVWVYVQWTCLIVASVSSLFLLIHSMTFHRLKRRMADFLLCVIGLSDFSFSVLEVLKQHIRSTYLGTYDRERNGMGSRERSGQEFIMSMLSRFCFFMSLYWVANLSLLMRLGRIDSLYVKRSFFVSVLLSSVYGCMHSTLTTLMEPVAYRMNGLLLLALQSALLAMIFSNLRFVRRSRVIDKNSGRNVIRRLTGYLICSACFTLPYSLALVLFRRHVALGAILETFNYLVPVANAVLFGTSLACCCASNSPNDLNVKELEVKTDNKAASMPIATEMITEGPVVKIGEGSSAIVYKTQWLGITVAMKCIRLQGIPEGSEDLYMTHMSDIQAEFCDEAALASQLRHPNITLFIKLGTYKGSMCLINEYCSRGSLRDVLKANPLMEWPTKVRLAFEAAKGLAFMHNREPIYLHRDIKASNILVTEDWTAKIADFGISRIATDYTTKKLTQQSERGLKGASDVTTFAGTWRWNAPEVMENPNECIFNRETDVYSFGMALWEILTNGATPFGDVAFDHQVRALVASGERPKFPPAYLRRAPAEFVEIIRACWDQIPENRPSAQEVMLRLGSLSYTLSDPASTRASSRHVFSDNYYQAMETSQSWTEL